MALEEKIPTLSELHQISVLEELRSRKHEKITSNLTGIVRAFVETSNPGEIQPYSSIWSHCAPSFTCEGNGPATAIMGSEATSAMDLDQFMRSRAELAIRFPHHFTKATNISVSIEDEDRCAQVFAYVEIHGLPEGTIRPIVAVFEFVLFAAQRGKEGKWRMIKLKRFPGMSIDGDMQGF